MEPVGFKLNRDELLIVFRYSTPEKLALFRKVCNEWRKLITADIWREAIYKCIAFGQNQYKKYFNWDVEHVDLPEDIYDEIMKMFHLSVDNGVTKIPILLLVDPNLPLIKFGEFVQPFLTKIEIEELNAKKDINQKPYWVLMMNGGICRKQYFNEHIAFIKQSNKYGIPLQFPTTDEVVKCIYAKYVVSKRCEFKNSTFIRTTDDISGYRVVVRPYGSSGLRIFMMGGCDGSNLVIAPLRKF
jgi:hypothetical protein